MYSVFNSQWFDISMRLVEPMISINKIMIDTTERVVNKQFDLAKDHLDFCRQQTKMMAEMKGQRLPLAEQGKIVASYGNRMMERRDEFMTIASDAKQSLQKVAVDSTINTARETASKIEKKSGMTAKAA